MEKEEIIRKYKELTDRIVTAKIYDGRGKFDIYICENTQCEHRILVTTYDAKGVTPFCIKCPECGHLMEHEMTYSHLPKGVKYQKWKRPSLDEALKMNDGELEHLFNGWLFLDKEIFKVSGNLCNK